MHDSSGYRAGRFFDPLNRGPGGQGSLYFHYPETVLAASGATLVAALQTVTGATTPAAMTLSSLATALVSIGGITYLDIGSARCLAISGTSGAVPVNVTVSGLEETVLQKPVGIPGFNNGNYTQLYGGQPMSQTLSTPSGAAITYTTKAFRFIRSIIVSGNTGQSIAVGTTDTIGFPYKVAYFDDVRISYNGTLVTTSTGYTAPDTTNPATALTNDVRGTFSMSSALLAGFNAVRNFNAEIFIRDPNTMSGLYGRRQV